MTSPSTPFTPLHISTDAFPARQRLAMWREIYGRNLTNVDIETIGDEPFRASVTFQGLPGVAVVSGSRSEATYRINRQQLSRARDVVILSALTDGAATSQQLGREIIGRPGTAVVLSGTDPSVNTMHRLGSFVTLVLPRPELAVLLPDLGAVYARQIPAENDALRLLIQYVKALGQGGELDTPGLAQAAASHIIDLSALAMGARKDVAHEATQRGVAAARLHAIKMEIRADSNNCDLSIAMVAARHGVTPRYVHKLFEGDGNTFSAFVLTCRLWGALQMLKDPRFATVTISAVAFECGFSDLSYFNRTFRRAYNATPSEIRDAALRAR